MADSVLPSGMHSYTIYNLTLHSDIPLEDLLPGGREPDITIRQTRLDPSQLAEGVRNGSRVTARLFYEPLESDVLFEIKDGRSIDLDPRVPIEPAVLRGWLTGIFMSVALRQRGYLALHASAVAKDGEAVAFLGGSGWGKSTLAEYFYQHGYEMITDDVLVLDVGEQTGRTVVLPGHRFIRLHENTAERFVDGYDGLDRVSSHTSKRIRPVDRGEDRPVVLKKLYVLDNQPAEAHRVEFLPPREALLHLLTHARSKDLLSAPEFQSSLMEQCGSLIRDTPVAQLRRRRDLDALGELKAVIEEDLASLDEAEAETSGSR